MLVHTKTIGRYMYYLHGKTILEGNQSKNIGCEGSMRPNVRNTSQHITKRKRRSIHLEADDGHTGELTNMLYDRANA